MPLPIRFTLTTYLTLDAHFHARFCLTTAALPSEIQIPIQNLPYAPSQSNILSRYSTTDAIIPSLDYPARVLSAQSFGMRKDAVIFD